MTCSISGCQQAVIARGYCGPHYKRERRAGALLPLPPRSVADRLQLKWELDRVSGCWIWTAARNQYGYGLIGVDKKCRLAHRVSFEQVRGAIPEGLVLDQLCRNRACVNPEHLEPVTLEENKARGIASPTKRACINGHEFTTENTYIATRDGRPQRHCRTCSRLRMRSRRAKTDELPEVAR